MKLFNLFFCFIAFLFLSFLVSSPVFAAEHQKVSQSLVSQDGKSAWARTCVINETGNSLKNCSAWNNPVDLLVTELDPQGFSAYGAYNFTNVAGQQKVSQSLVSRNGKTSWARSCILNSQTDQLESCSAWSKPVNLTKTGLDSNGFVSYDAYQYSDTAGQQKVVQTLLSSNGKISWARNCNLNSQTEGLTDCSVWSKGVDLTKLGLDPNGFTAYGTYAYLNSQGQYKLEQSLVSSDGKTSWARVCIINRQDGVLTSCSQFTDRKVDLTRTTLDPNGFSGYGAYFFKSTFQPPSPAPLQIISIKINNQEIGVSGNILKISLLPSPSTDLPIEVTYNNSTKKFLILRFNYQAPPEAVIPPVQTKITLNPDKRAQGPTGYITGEEVTINFIGQGGTGKGSVNTALLESGSSLEAVVQKFGLPAWENSFQIIPFSGGSRKAKVPFYLEYTAQEGKNKEPTQKLGIAADSTPPVSKFSLSKTSGFIAGETITVVVDATDLGSGIKQIHVTFKEGTAYENEAKKDQISWTGNYKTIVPKTTLELKVPFYLETTAEDQNGNKEGTQTLSVGDIMKINGGDGSVPDIPQGGEDTAPNTQTQRTYDEFANEIYRIYKDTDILTSYQAALKKWREAVPVQHTATKHSPRHGDIMGYSKELAQFTQMYIYRYYRYKDPADLIKAREYVQTIINAYPQWKHFWQGPGAMYYLGFDVWWLWNDLEQNTKNKFQAILAEEADFWVEVLAEIKKNPGKATLPIEIGRGRGLRDGCHFRIDQNGQPVTLKNAQGQEVLDTDGNPFLEIDDNPVFCPPRDTTQITDINGLTREAGYGCKLYRSTTNNLVNCDGSNLSVLTTDVTRDYHLLDTRAEESGWNTEIFSLAYSMFPNHPNAQKWKDAGRVFGFHTLSKGETDNIPGYGFTTRTISDDGLLGNHSLAPNPRYTGAATGQLILSQLNFLIGSTPIPSELKHNMENGISSQVWQRNMTFCMRNADPDNPDFRMKDSGIRTYEEYIKRPIGTVCPYSMDWGDTEVNAPFHFAFWEAVDKDKDAGKFFRRSIEYFYSPDKLAKLKNKQPVPVIDFQKRDEIYTAWRDDKYIPDQTAKYFVLTNYQDNNFRQNNFPKSLVAESTPANSSGTSVLKINYQTLSLAVGSNLDIQLPGQSGEEKSFDIPVEITSASGQTRRTIIRFNYQPGSSIAFPSSSAPVVVSEQSIAENKFDLNSDGVVNSLDISIFNVEINKQLDKRTTDLDFNNDNIVNGFDFSLLVKNLSK